jgi:hypothetical protein
MARCFVFDKQTARAISTNLHLLTICDPDADALPSALESDSRQILLALPAEDSERVLVARFQRHPDELYPAEPGAEAAATFEAGGFLGLSDQPVFDPEPQPPKKWWQKLLD